AKDVSPKPHSFLKQTADSAFGASSRHLCRFLTFGVSFHMLPKLLPRLLLHTSRRRNFPSAARRPLQRLLSLSRLAASPVAAAMSTGRAAIPATGQITGNVTAEATGAGIPGVQIVVYSTSGQFVANTFSSGAAGAYSVTGLPAGSYHLFTLVASNQNFIDELY